MMKYSPLLGLLMIGVFSIGFASFAVMVIFAAVDIITGFYGKELVIQDYIYNSFVIITLGSFGIAEVGKIFGNKNKNEEIN